jgi:hypothetical protein
MTIRENEFYFAMGKVLIKAAEARGEQLSDLLKADIIDLEKRFNVLFNQVTPVVAPHAPSGAITGGSGYTRMQGPAVPAAPSGTKPAIYDPENDPEGAAKADEYESHEDRGPTRGMGRWWRKFWRSSNTTTDAPG